MRITVIEVPAKKRHWVITLEGRLDSSQTQQFTVELFQLVAAKKLRITINMRKLEFIGSNGLWALSQAVKKNASITLLGARPSVRERIDLAGLKSLFTFED